MVTRWRRAWLVVGASVLLLSSTYVLGGQLFTPGGGSAPPTTLPAGIYWLGPREASVPEAILANPSIRGVVLRMRWQDIEPQEGSYNWSYFDAEIKRAVHWGKAVSLRFPAGGRNTPEWVMRLPGVEK